MKTTIKIAKLELSTLFYSPIAWFLLIVFLFQCGFVYTNILNTFVTYQELGSYKDYLVYLTQKMFGQPTGMLPDIMTKLYLYLPLLTMGLMSREISSGTIKLLYSSPIKISTIIFGKFLAMMVYNLILVMILFVIVITAMFNIQGADIGMLLSGLLGIYLLLCAYAAIGLFMSSLTSYQVVAALSTFVVFAILAYIGTLWQDIDFVRDLTYSLSISGRTEKMIDGLISTKDLFYFGVIIYIFLGLSILKIRAARESKSTLVKAGKYTALIISALLISYLSSTPGLIAYYDATTTHTQTLTKNAQTIIKETGNEPLLVTSYINLLDQRYSFGLPNQRNVDKARWERYLRYKTDIQFKYVYYYDSIPDPWIYKGNKGKNLQQIAEMYAKTYKVDIRDYKTPAQMHQIIDLRPEQNRYVMQLQYKGKTTFLRLYNDQAVFPSETETSAALKRMMSALPKIAFLQGELERSPDKMGDKEYKVLTSDITFRYALINQGFDIETVTGEIPAGIAALVIADPKTEFAPAVLAKVQQYITDGGNLLIAGEPGKQAVLNPLLQQLGVQLTEGVLVQPGREFSANLVLPHLTASSLALSKTLNRSFNDSVVVSMPGAAGISYKTDGAYKITPLLMTDPKVSWNKKGKLTLDSAAVVFEDGDDSTSVATAVSLTRQVNGKEQRIVVTGDADFLSNIELQRYNMNTANFRFNTAIFNWLNNGVFPIDTSRPDSTDTHLNVTGPGVLLLKYIFLGILPVILLIMGTILLIRRKKK
jgi:ABC-2 type transport system permease protein